MHARTLALAVAVAAGALAREAPAQAPSTARRAITFADFQALKGLSDPQISPDGARVLYAVRTTDVAANRRSTVTVVVPAAGGASRRFPDDTTPAAEARWSPDGRQVAYTSRGQLWVADASGGSRRQLTTLNGGASGPVWAAAGGSIAFTSSVYPSCGDDACNAARAKAADTSKVKAHIADQLLYRHWTAWDEGQRSHLFVVASSGGAPRDVTPNATYDVPPGPFGGSEGYAFSPDGAELAYTAKPAMRDQAWTTNLEVFTVPAAGGPAASITGGNMGADQNPTYSPDGRYIAYASQARAGFESDRWRLMLYDRSAKAARELMPRWDRSADAVAWAADSRTLYVQAADAGRDKIYRVRLDTRIATPTPQLVVATHNNSAFTLSRSGVAAWARDAADRPAEIMVANVATAGAPAERRVSHENDALLAQLDLRPAEDFWYRGADGDSVQGFVVRPPNYDASKKYPVLLLIHGGPQGAWLDSWSGRWNYAMFASTGNALVFVNPRGSTGYGQKFVDQVSKDWGGRAYTDIMSGLDAALAQNRWMDSTRMGAAGGSYGGYMVNWIAGHTDRFKALFTHAGVFNLENMYGATEEVWFGEWEYGGPYWDSTAMATQYRKFSPHLFASHFRTPTLVIHGEMDYRVPYTEGLSMFTALQRQGVPSRLVVFPDEGHWIGKPQNQQLWWREVHAWFGRYLSGDQKPAT